MKRLIIKIRFELVKMFLNLSLLCIDKKTVEGMGLLLAVKDWIEFINSDKADEIRKKYSDTVK